MKILITGSSGQLGTSLCRSLQKYKIIECNSRFAEKDIFFDEIKNIEFDLLINCVALHDLSLCEKNKVLSDIMNTNIPYKLSEICKNKKKKFIHFSTDYVFDGLISRKYHESDITKPLNYYGLSKLNGEKLITKNKNSLIFRVSSLFGTRRNVSSKNFIEKIINLSKKVEKIDMVEDQIMNPTSTNLISDIFNKNLESILELNGVFHLCHKKETTWFEFTKFIFEKLKIKTKLDPINYEDLKSDINRPLNTTLSTKKIENSLNININSWEENLIDYLNEFK